MFKNKDLKSVVLALAGANGTSGNENEAALLAKSMLEEYMPAHIDTLGSVCGDTGGDGMHIMLDAHIDRIGMTVTAIDDSGFIKFERVGGIDARVGVCYTDLQEIINAITFANVVIAAIIVIGAVLGAAIGGWLMGFFPIESAITAGLCMANRGGSGDLEVLSACNRMNLISYAQISSRLGGGIVLVIASIVFGMMI